MLDHLLPFNIITASDGYKANHWLETSLDVKQKWTVIVPRKPSKYADEIVSAGATMLASVFASVRITEQMINSAERIITPQGYNFNRQGWTIICRMLDGKLPLRVYGVEEGRVVKPQTPIVGIVNTHDSFGWLATYVETFSQALVWKMSTVASICRKVRKTLEKYCDQVGTDKAAVNYMLHNFGDRGADSPHEAAVLAGIAHAMIFDGSDCIRANPYIQELYRTDKHYTSSIEATEHSVMCEHSDAKNRDDFGAAIMAVDRLEARVASAKAGIGIPFMSVVVDTYDAYRFTGEYLGTNRPNIVLRASNLKDRIVNSGGRMICRPDSGNPNEEPGKIGNILAERFGYTENALGYKVLADCVGVIQGDGIRIDTFEDVVLGWIKAGFSLDNFCLGMGSGVTHDGARDDFSFSFKAIASRRGDTWEPELKDPITDSGKKSLSGLVRCRENANGELEVYDALHEGNVYSMWTAGPGWRLYYEDGWTMYVPNFDDVQKRARA
jgi:nicotinamide phosphoribosyltransferase